MVSDGRSSLSNFARSQLVCFTGHYLSSVDEFSVQNDSQRPADTTKRGQIKDLGTIKIEFHRCKIVGESPIKSRELDKDLGGTSVLTEKQLKGKSVTHGVAYGSLFSSSLT